MLEQELTEKIANKIADKIEHILSKAMVVDRINNDEIVTSRDYLAVAGDVFSLIKEEIKVQLENQI